MNDKIAPARRPFQAEIYQPLDRKLRDSNWNSGATEAHGLLSGLACRGIRSDQLRTKAWLLQLSDTPDLDLIQGMYDLLLRALQTDGFEFTLLLPDEDGGDAHRLELLSEWCHGFLQGFVHDGEDQLASVAGPVREALDDILAISQIALDAQPDADTERRLFEIEEYLRVAVQVIFEELNPNAGAGQTGAKSPSTNPPETQ